MKLISNDYLKLLCNQFPCTALILLSTLNVKVEGALYDFDQATTLTNLNGWSASAQKSTVVALDFDFPLFGNASLDRFWVSAHGTLSYNQLISKEMSPETTDDNIVVAPLFLPSSAGNCQYERYNPSSASQSQLEEAEGNVNAWLGFNGFTATHGMLVQWTDAVSAEDSSLKNTFQAFVVTDEDQSYRGVDDFVFDFRAD